MCFALVQWRPSVFCCRSGEPRPQGLNEDGASTPVSAARRGTSVAMCVPLSRLRAAPEHVCYVEAIKPPSNDALFTRAFVYLQDRKRSGGKEARGTQVGAQGREEGRQSEAARSVPAAAAAQVRAALRHQCMPFQLACKRDTWKFTWSVARRLASSSGLWHRRGAKAEAKTMKDESSDDEEELSES